ncbi:MAG TPA: hypothetical protein VHZ52_12750 [Acidobacteriaceae bacterium]|jgi:hypothetical protein|nr:hypothetical protein [Acidobacteriaceae bacterium]
MKIASIVARVLLGLAFLIFGLNGFLNFIPAPPMPDSPMKQFVDVFASSHWQQVISAIQVISAVLFLVGRYIPLALVFIGPVIFNILVFHILFAPSSIGPGVFVTICWFVVFFRHRAAFAPLFQARA